MLIGGRRRWNPTPLLLRIWQNTPQNHTKSPLLWPEIGFQWQQQFGIHLWNINTGRNSSKTVLINNFFFVRAISFFFPRNICRRSCEIVTRGNPHKHIDNLTPRPSKMVLFSARRAYSWLSHVILIPDGDWLRLSSWWTLDRDYAAKSWAAKSKTPDVKAVAGRQSIILECFFYLEAGVRFFDLGFYPTVVVLWWLSSWAQK